MNANFSQLCEGIATWTSVPDAVWRGFFEGKIYAKDAELLITGNSIISACVDDITQRSRAADKVIDVSASLLFYESERDSFQEYARGDNMRGKHDVTTIRVDNERLLYLHNGRPVTMEYAYSNQCTNQERLEMVQKLVSHADLDNSIDQTISSKFRLLIVTLALYLRDSPESNANKLTVLDAVSASVALLCRVQK